MLFDIQGSSLSGQGTAVSNLFSPRNAGLAGSGFGGNNKLKPILQITELISMITDFNFPSLENMKLQLDFLI